MKTFTLTLFLLATTMCVNSSAQDAPSSEKYGKTLNLGLGAGYYRYANHSMPVLSLNYEFSVAKNFTVAPFISFYTYRNHYYWGNKNNPYKYYSYSETVIPVGAKGTYYFDDLLKANPKWDFYLGASLGFAFRSVSWDDGYYGEQYAYHNSNGLYLDAHIGAEYHISQRLGMFLDLSSGVSTIGLAIH